MEQRNLSLIRILCTLVLLLRRASAFSARTRPQVSSSLSSIGERIQQSACTSDLLQVANDLWLPTDDNLPSHLKTQRVHHEKRQRWSAQLLGKMGALARSCHDDDDAPSWQEDKGFERAILAVCTPFQEDRPEKEGRYLREALVGLHNMFGYVALSNNKNVKTVLSDPVKQGILELVQRADNLAPRLPLPEVAEMRWACLGIFARSNVLDEHGHGATVLDKPDDRMLVQMNARVAGLPFDLVPNVIDWEEIFPKQQATSRLQDEIPFHFDTIVTRTGAAVTERRGTAWIAQDGIGALAYSGKLMPPHSISDSVRSLMRLVEDRVIDERDFPRPFFDCALCNHYPDGESACKFHTDPEHGTHWERLNCVVAAGSPRRFAFRPIPGHSTWSAWESPTTIEDAVFDGKKGDPNTPAAITMFPGDVAKMWGTCNDDFHHAVYPGQARPGETDISRISLVLKRAMPRHGGLRGHRLSGEGRRSRRKVGKSEEIPAFSKKKIAPVGQRKRQSKPQRR